MILFFSKEIKVNELGGRSVCAGCVHRFPRVCFCLVCFRRSPGCWHVSHIYTTSFSLQLAESQSSLAARVDSSGLLRALWHAARCSLFCTRTSVSVPSRYSRAAAACLITAVGVFLAVPQAHRWPDTQRT